MKSKDEAKEARIVVSNVVTKVAHVCDCDSSHPSFEGEVAGVGVQWPVAFGRYRMSYCPWCGKHLPNRWEGKGATCSKEVPNG